MLGVQFQNAYVFFYISGTFLINAVLVVLKRINHYYIYTDIYNKVFRIIVYCENEMKK